MPQPAAGPGSDRARALGPAATLDMVERVGPARARRRRVPRRNQVDARSRGPLVDAKYIVCNADEGDSGTFADRMVMEGDPFLLLERHCHCRLTLSGQGAGYIYVRSEYPHAIAQAAGRRSSSRCRTPRAIHGRGARGRRGLCLR